MVNRISAVGSPRSDVNQPLTTKHGARTYRPNEGEVMHRRVRACIANLRVHIHVLPLTLEGLQLSLVRKLRLLTEESVYRLLVPVLVESPLGNRYVSALS